MTSAMPVQCSNQLSYEVTQWRAGQFVGLMFSRERNVISPFLAQNNEKDPKCQLGRFCLELINYYYKYMYY